MLTEEQKLNFCKATAVWNGGSDAFDDEIAQVCEVSDVVSTRDTVENFASGPAKNGRYKTVNTPVGILHVWEGFRVRAGKRRGNAYVMDFGDARASFFDGEI